LTVLSHPAHSPHLAPSNYNPVGPVKNALRGRHFADYNELEQRNRVFMACYEGEAENFAALVYSVLLKVRKTVLKMTEILQKNSLIIAKDVEASV
jgi:hypothetical protein